MASNERDVVHLQEWRRDADHSMGDLGRCAGELGLKQLSFVGNHRRKLSSPSTKLSCI